MEPWEWPPAAIAAVARDIRATTGRIVDDNSFYESIKWFCDQRPEGCRGAKLQKDGWSSRLDYDGEKFSVSPWDWPRSIGVDVADELHAGATRDYRRAWAEDIATQLCRGNTSCAALPGQSVVLELMPGSIYTCRPREEPAGCVARAARAAKAGNGSVAAEDLRAAARRALRSLCAVRLCTQALPEPAMVSGVLLEPWDDVDEWAAAHFPPGAAAERRRDACAKHRYWCGDQTWSAPGGSDLDAVPPLTGRFVWLLHIHKAAGTSFCSLALRNGLRLAPHEPETHGHLELGAERLDLASADGVLDGLRRLQARGIGFGSTEHKFLAPPVLEAVAAARGVAFVVIVRDPVNRTLSSYRFHGGGGGRCEGGPCADVIAFGEAEADLTARMLLGGEFGPMALRQAPGRLRADVAAVKARPDESLREALVALQRFDLVLVFERLGDAATADLVTATLGWSDGAVERVLPAAAVRHSSPPPVDEAAVQALEKMNAIDRRVHAAAIRRFDADVQRLRARTS